MSSAGENRQCESRREEEEGDNADVDEDEEVDIAIRNEMKRRAEKLLNMHQKVENGKNAQSFVVHRKDARVPLLISHFFTVILWKIT